MKSKSERTKIAETAIFLLREGINDQSKLKIKAAYELIEEDDGFNWDNLEVIYMEWEELIDDANNIIYS